MTLEPFCKLADPKRYQPCSWNLTADLAGRTHWVEFFKRHINTILTLGIESETARGASIEEVQRRAKACKTAFNKTFDAYYADPNPHGRVTILILDNWRDIILREHGFGDAFIDLKARENEKMLPFLPGVCQQIDALSGAPQIRALTEGIFAGNIFDMGAEATTKAFLHGGPDFFQIRAKLKPRPWLIDDYDALENRLLNGSPHKKAVFFVDNAGSDFLLGALPFMRWLARRGAQIVLTANERPTLNDMTIHDVRNWWPRILATEPSFASLPIQLITSGTGEPLIDLGAVSPELNAASHDADLIILEGMGRGIESNIDAIFTCDALNIGMIKDEGVAGYVGGSLYDLVCRFR